jgi:hypothetical protein
LSGTLVANLGLRPEVWLFLSVLACLTLFFKFNRVWSMRNLDLLLLFALAPGMLRLVGGDGRSWGAFLWLFVASGLWLARCLVDLGLPRRPALEPNLNASGLTCLAVGVLGLMVAETISLPVGEEAARNPAGPRASGAEQPQARPNPPSEIAVPMTNVLKHVPLPDPIRRRHPYVVLSRILSVLAHLGIVAALLSIGSKLFERPIAGLAMAVCYLILPYTRFALVDHVQLMPAALVVAALAFYSRPIRAGALIGLASGGMPACLALVPLWAGFYRGRGALPFMATALGVLAFGAILGWMIPGLGDWAPALEWQTLWGSGLIPGVEAPAAGSFWSGIDALYRLPVLILYASLVGITAFLPWQKDLNALICLSAALLVAAQFWYLGAGGTLVILYEPLVLLMMFRPNLAAKRALPRPDRAASKAANLAATV